MGSRSNRYLEQEFMRPDHSHLPLPKNPSAILDRRNAERVSLFSHVTYMDATASDSLREGQLINLSIQGCRIVGVAPSVGSTTTLSLDLEDGQQPIAISGATVSWKDDDSFGVRFPLLAVGERQRVQKCVLKFVTLHGVSAEHIAFRFA
jgi:hypothetical protein